MFRNLIRSKILLSLFFSCVAFSRAQSSDAIQEMAQLLPDTTFFYLSLNKPAKTSKQLFSLSAGQITKEVEFQKFVQSSLDKLSQLKLKTLPVQKDFLALLSSLHHLLDQGFHFVGVLPPKEMKQELQWAWIGSASKTKNLQQFLTLVGDWLLGDYKNEIISHSQEKMFLYEIPLYQTSFYYSIVGQNIILAHQKEAVLYLAQQFQTTQKEGLHLANDPLYQKVKKDFGKTTSFFGYFNIEKLLQNIFPISKRSGKKWETWKLFGADKVQSFSLKLSFRKQQLTDHFVLHLKDRQTGIASVLEEGPNSFVATSLCPKNTIFFASLKLSPAKLTRLLLDVYEVQNKKESDSTNLFSKFQESMRLRYIHDFFGMLGNEVSGFVAIPRYGFLPDVGLMAPLEHSKAFFQKLQLFLRSQQMYSLEHFDYLNQQIYYLQPKSYRSLNFSPSFTCIENHLVFSYSVATVKKLVKLKHLKEETFFSSSEWQSAQKQIPGTHEGILFIHTKNIFRTVYELISQLFNLLALKLPIDSVLLPETETLAKHFTTSATFFKYTPTSIEAYTVGDGLNPGGWCLGAFDVASLMLASDIHQRVPNLIDNETMAIKMLHKIASSQNRFQFDGTIDTDLDGMGEYGWLQELSGLASLRGNLSQKEKSLIPKILGLFARQNNGIAKKHGYHFLMYLPTKNGPALAEPGALNKEHDDRQTPENANAQEMRWLCYAWPVLHKKTGRRCFAINQEGRLFVSENAVYSGLEQFPSSEAFFAKEPGNKKIQWVQNLKGSLPLNGEKTWDGFDWKPFEK